MSYWVTALGGGLVDHTKKERKGYKEPFDHTKKERKGYKEPFESLTRWSPPTNVYMDDTYLHSFNCI